MDFAVVFYETEFPEFIHEQINSGPRCANHFREHLLRHLGKHLLRLTWRAIAREQQQGARQSFLTGVEELVYKVRLDSNVSREHVGPFSHGTRGGRNGGGDSTENQRRVWEIDRVATDRGRAEVTRGKRGKCKALSPKDRSCAMNQDDDSRE
jgi:hypothetical protein